MGRPPLSVGAVHESEIVVAVLPVKTTLVGAAGATAGMMLVSGVDQLLVPSAVVCATRNWYGIERVRPVTVIVVDVDTPSLNVVQFVPSVEYWIV